MSAAASSSRLRRSQNGRPQPSRLLRRFQKDLFPPRTPLARRCNKRFIAASRRQQHDFRHAQFRRLLQTPFEPVEFHQRNQKLDLQRRLALFDFFHQCKFNPIAAASSTAQPSRRAPAKRAHRRSTRKAAQAPRAKRVPNARRYRRAKQRSSPRSYR